MCLAEKIVSEVSCNVFSGMLILTVTCWLCCRYHGPVLLIRRTKDEMITTMLVSDTAQHLTPSDCILTLELTIKHINERLDRMLTDVRTAYFSAVLILSLINIDSDGDCWWQICVLNIQVELQLWWKSVKVFERIRRNAHDTQYNNDSMTWHISSFCPLLYSPPLPFFGHPQRQLEWHFY